MSAQKVRGSFDFDLELLKLFVTLQLQGLWEILRNYFVHKMQYYKKNHLNKMLKLDKE